MSIPIDRLYHYLNDLVNRDVIIYRWTPHGSKNLADLRLLKPRNDLLTSLCTPMLVCHDQEPLDYYFYERESIRNETKAARISHYEKISTIPGFNSAYNMPVLRLQSGFGNIHDLILLAHSEVHSPQVSLYEANGFVPVYIWSHAIIARDWYRYAEFDPILTNKPPKYDFLIYNRAWKGTREYRLKFAELVVSKDLADNCLMGFAPFEGNEHYTKHQFKNKSFKIASSELEKNFFFNTSDSGSSADYVNCDYNRCGIEVVLETLFDDTRWHLTEKTLRPIACGKPFILAATPGSLSYLKSYGFETFSSILDESYDSIYDPTKRLEAIVSEMKRLSNLDRSSKEQMFGQLNLIAQRNKQRFFSTEFQEQVIQEYKENFILGYNKVLGSRYGKTLFKHLDFLLKECPEVIKLTAEEIAYIRSLLILQ